MIRCSFLAVTPTFSSVLRFEFSLVEVCLISLVNAVCLRVNKLPCKRTYLHYAMCLILTVFSIGVSADSLDRSVHLTLAGPSDARTDISACILIEAYDNLDISIDTQRLPSLRSLVTSNNGNADGELNRISGLDERYPNLVQVPTPVNEVIGTAFYKDGVADIRTWEDLRPYMIGIKRGTQFSADATQGMRVRDVTTLDQLFSLLDIGRIDVVVVDHFVGLDMIQKKGLRDIKVSKLDVESIKLFHYLHKKNSHLVPVIEQELKAMNERGRIREIHEEAMNGFLK